MARPGEGPAEPSGPRSSRARLGALAAAVGGGFVIVCFHSVALVYYGGLGVPQGQGMESLLASEVMHYTLFLVFGAAAAALFAFALLGTSLPAAARSWFRRLSARPLLAALLCGALLVAACLLVSVGVLGDAILTDDEHVYRFIAQTLRTGSLTAPSPGGDLEFYFEQFVVLTDTVRYGKYPIGFPLLLAAGQVLGLERAVVPLLTGLLALLLAWVGLKACEGRVVVLALVFFTLSPQVLLTGGATLLSQPLSAVSLMAALGCLLSWDARRAPGAPWLAATGAILAYGMVTRPLPVVLFAGVVVAALLAGPRAGFRRRPRLWEWVALLATLALGPALLLWTNYRQSGHPLQSGYHAVHADFGPALMLYGSLATWTMSVVSHLVRINFWLLGWPLSLAFCALARRSLFAVLAWGMVGAELLYRVLSPKAGVGHAGPLYFYEIVPVLCLLSADGVFALGRRLSQWPGPPGLVRALRPEALAAAFMALTAVNLTLFLPFKLSDVARAAASQQVVFRELRRREVRNAIVFHRTIVPPWLNRSWAYFPPPNPPGMDADVLFAFLQVGPEGLARTHDFWRRRYPERQAWVFAWDQEKGPFLVPLTTYLTTDDATRVPTGEAAAPAERTPGPAASR